MALMPPHRPDAGTICERLMGPGAWGFALAAVEEAVSGSGQMKTGGTTQKTVTGSKAEMGTDTDGLCYASVASPRGVRWGR